MLNQKTSNQQAFSPRTIVIMLLPKLIYAAVIPFLIYRVGSGDFHLSTVNALLLAAISPAVGLVIEFVRKRQLSVLGLVALLGIAAKVLSAVLFHDPHLVLISDSLLSGVLGLLLLGSVLIGKPLVVVLAINMYAKSPEQRTQMTQSLQASGIRRHLLILTVMCGVGLLLMLAVSVLLTYTLPIATVVLIRPIIDYGIIALIVACTIAYRYIAGESKRRQIAQ